MSATTTADEHMQRAREHIKKAREEVGAVLLGRKTMWGADDFADGYVRNVFDRLDALSRAIDGDDLDGNARGAAIPEVRALREIGGETDPALDAVVGHWSKLPAEQREGVAKAVALMARVGLDRAFSEAIGAAVDVGLLRRCDDPSHNPVADTHPSHPKA